MCIYKRFEYLIALQDFIYSICIRDDKERLKSTNKSIPLYDVACLLKRHLEVCVMCTCMYVCMYV